VDKNRGSCESCLIENLSGFREYNDKVFLKGWSSCTSSIGSSNVDGC